MQQKLKPAEAAIITSESVRRFFVRATVVLLTVLTTVTMTNADAPPRRSTNDSPADRTLSNPSAAANTTPRVRLRRLPSTTSVRSASQPTESRVLELPRGIFTAGPLTPTATHLPLASRAAREHQAAAALGTPLPQSSPEATLLSPIALPPASESFPRSTQLDGFEVPFWLVPSSSATTRPIELPFSSASLEAAPYASGNDTVTELVAPNTAFASERNRDGELPANTAPSACGDQPTFYSDFSPTPIDNISMYPDGQREQWVYDNRCSDPATLGGVGTRVLRKRDYAPRQKLVRRHKSGTTRVLCLR